MSGRCLAVQFSKSSCWILRYDFVLYGMIENLAKILDYRCDGVFGKFLLDHQRGHEPFCVFPRYLIQAFRPKGWENMVLEVVFITIGG